MKSMEHNRLVTFDGTVNFRDIGGYENDEGKHVKIGRASCREKM